ncbi:DUF3560 domain-containing protein [Rhodococcus sp. NPDC003318]|uniref:DUF3560 domain-containing protein n=1 Tax=Rhodococcus sp. NPDC003318 TaxID=3364503 RepID=UPI0036A32A1B
MLTITHSEAGGTMIEGTAKNDGSAAALKAHGWRWSRNLGAWYLPRTRDAAPKTSVITATADALRETGFDVTVTIDAGVRDIATVEADRAQRQADRVDALSAKADRRRDQLEAAEARDRAAHNALPPMGEPIKIGHHSEGRHRRAHDRAHAATRTRIEAAEAVAAADARTDAATTTTARRNSPAVIARRIERLSADRRAAQRELDGYSRTIWVVGDTRHTETNTPAVGRRRAQLRDSIERFDAQIRYWEEVRAAQDADGRKLYARDDINPGDLVKVCGRWHKVKRVNAKSVSVETEYSWTDTVKYDAITDVADPQTRKTRRPGENTA